MFRQFKKKPNTSLHPIHYSFIGQVSWAMETVTCLLGLDSCFSFHVNGWTVDGQIADKIDDFGWFVVRTNYLGWIGNTTYVRSVDWRINSFRSNVWHGFVFRFAGAWIRIHSPSYLRLNGVFEKNGHS